MPDDSPSTFSSFFCLDMQDNCVTFVFLTGTFMGVYKNNIDF